MSNKKPPELSYTEGVIKVFQTNKGKVLKANEIRSFLAKEYSLFPSDISTLVKQASKTINIVVTGKSAGTRYCFQNSVPKPKPQTITQQIDSTAEMESIRRDIQALTICYNGINAKLTEIGTIKQLLVDIKNGVRNIPKEITEPIGTAIQAKILDEFAEWFQTLTKNQKSMSNRLGAVIGILNAKSNVKVKL